jgi:aspartyl-tRNA(Asn)/glutamyl-tRNA(Gln) amidotransferase subunit C
MSAFGRKHGSIFASYLWREIKSRRGISGTNVRHERVSVRPTAGTARREDEVSRDDSNRCLMAPTSDGICPLILRRRLRINVGLPAMSQSADLDIDHVAKLARLALTPEEKVKFAHQLADVLHHIEQLKKVDVSHVEPTAHAAPVFNVWADDLARPGLPVEHALQNAPAQRDHMVVVPKVVE